MSRIIHKQAILGILGSIREKYQSFLEKELRERGIEGLVSSHGSILAVLYKNEGKLKMNEVAEKIGRAKSTLTELVNKLEKEQYIRKIPCQEDRRSTYIQLTEKGYEIKNDFDAISKKLIKTVYQGFTEDEQETLINLLMKVYYNF